MEQNEKRKHNDKSYDTETENKKIKLTSEKKALKIQLKVSTATPKPKEPEKIKQENENTTNKTTNLNAVTKVIVNDEKVSKVFGEDSDDDNEEMPSEAKLKMRNIGRNTPTASGPNSYGKTQLGFCDHRKLFEKKLKEKADELSKQS